MRPPTAGAVKGDFTRGIDTSAMAGERDVTNKQM
jgi:hypothetical protein